MEDSWTADFGHLDTTSPTWAAKRPVRIAVLGDFSAGAAAGRLETGADLARRKLIPVEFDTLEDTLARLQVKLNLPIGEGGAGVEVEFSEIDSFHPDQLYRELDLFKALADLRKRLNNTATFAKAAAEVQAWAGTSVRKASRTNRRRSRSGAPAAGAKLSDFARLVGTASEVDTDTPVSALLRRIVGPFVQKAPDPKRDPLIATVDNALADAMRTVLHASEFQNLESLWRGMDMLLRRLETGPMLQVMLVDVSAEEFAADLSSASDLAETGLYQMLVEKPSHDKNGGLSLICGLYQFEATPPHTELLGRMAKIAAHAGAPFVTSMNADGFMRRKEPPHPLVEQAMQELRGLAESSHLALLAPRFLLRHPYGKRGDPISAFNFEEFTSSDGLSGMLWGHPAILAACVLGAPRGQTQSIGDLPFHFFTDADGDQIALPCTERMVNTDTSMRLSTFGIRALMAHKGQPEVRIAGLETMGGTVLALNGMGKPAPRVGVTTSISSKLGATATAISRGAKASDDGDADADSGAASGDSSDNLDDLLGSLSDSGSSDDSASASASDDSGDGDTSLDDLLASLGGDDGSASSDAPPSDEAATADASEDSEMDPDLAALLKSLE